MAEYKIIEKFKNKNLSFNYSGEYINEDELNRDYISTPDIIKNTIYKSSHCIIDNLRERIITGISCEIKGRKRFFVYKKDFEEVAVKINDRLIDFNSALKSLNSLGIIEFKENFYSVSKRLNIRETHILYPRYRYFNKQKFEKLKKNIIDINEEYRSVEWIRNTIKERCAGFQLYNEENGVQINKFFKERDYKILDINDTFNFYRKQMYSKDGCNVFINEIINASVDYFKEESLYFRSIDSLKKDDVESFYYTYEQFNLMLNDLGVGEGLPVKTADIDRFYRFDITFIKIRNSNRDVRFLFRKEEVDELIEKSKGFINLDKAREMLNELTNKEIYKSFFEARNISVYKRPTTLFKSKYYVKEEDIVPLREQLQHERALESSKSTYGIYKIKLNKENLELKNIDVLNKYDEYVIKKSNDSTARKIYAKTNIYVGVYKILYKYVNENVLSKPLEDKVKLSKKLIKIALMSSKSVGEAMIRFLNEVVVPNNKIRIDNEESTSYIKYDDDSFTTLLIKILAILDEPDLFKELLYKRSYSSAILYVFIHFVFAWRKTDLQEQLPKPNLKLIGYNDGISFLSDLKDDKFKFEEYHGEKICKDISEYIVRMGLRSYKNNEELESSIPASIYKYLGLLICICEGNRQYTEKYTKKKYQNTKDLIAPSGTMNVCICQAFNEFGIDIEDVLGEGFRNISGTKSFFSVLGERFEELNMCTVKAVSELRAHKVAKHKLSNVETKYYLVTEISKASIELFAKETMGCVKDYILKLTDKEYELLNDERQLEKFKSLKLTNTEIDNIHKNLVETTAALAKFFKEFEGDKERVQEFLRELLYGESYSRHSYCKCLLKAKINANNNIVLEKGDIGFSECTCPIRADTCVTCVYHVASRLFIYEFRDILCEFLDQFEKLKDTELKKLFVRVFKEKYAPLLYVFKAELGDEMFKHVLNSKRYKAFKKEADTLKHIEKGGELSVTRTECKY